MQLRSGKIINHTKDEIPNIARYLCLPSFLIDVVDTFSDEAFYNKSDYELIVEIFNNTDREYNLETDKKTCVDVLGYLIKKFTDPKICRKMKYVYISIFYRLVYGTRLYWEFLSFDSDENKRLKDIVYKKLEEFQNFKLHFTTIDRQFMEYLSECY